MRPILLRVVPRACAFLCALGLARGVYFHFVVERPFPWPPGSAQERIGQRYEGLRPLLSPWETVGYLSDVPLDRQDKPPLHFNAALYSLAPTVVVPGDRSATRVIADLRDPAGLAALCRAHGLTPLAVLPNGVALLARR